MSHKTCQNGVHEVFFLLNAMKEGTLPFSHSLQAERLLNKSSKLRQNTQKKKLSKQTDVKRQNELPAITVGISLCIFGAGLTTPLVLWDI